MQNSILVHTLKTLSARERTRFGHYVASPCFNKHPALRALCSHLLEHAPKFDGPSMDKAWIYEHVFGEGQYEELKLNNLMSDLLQLLYDFLALLCYEADELQRKYYLSAATAQRGLTEQTERILKRYHQLLAQFPYRQGDYYKHRVNLYEQADWNEASRHRRADHDYLQQKNNALDLYYFIQKFQLACDMTNRNAVLKADYKCHFIDELAAIYATDPALLHDVPALVIYHRAHVMLRDTKNLGAYFELKSLLHEHAAIFPVGELRVLYNYALNHCVRQINSGHTQYYKEVLDLYKALLAKAIIFHNKQLSQWTYANIITAGVRLQEYEWTERFIAQYRDYLPPSVAHNAYTYNLAAFYYEKGDLDKALHLLLDVEFTDAFYHLSAKIIQLKVYYDRRADEAFLSLIKASRQYISRNGQLSEYQKVSNAHFLKVAAKLHGLRQKQHAMPRAHMAEALQKLNAQLEGMEEVANKDWLAEAIAAAIKEWR